MDGFAVRREDLEGEDPWTPPAVDDVPAGDTHENHLEREQAWRIITGVPIPEDADTVVKVEHTDYATGITQAPDSVEIRVVPKLGVNVHVAGKALKAGSPVLRADHVLDGTVLSATASVGRGILTILSRPRVIVVSAGTELKRTGKTLERGQIPDSNGILPYGLIEEAGGQVVAHLRTGDASAELRRALNETPEAGLVLTISGTSVGVFEVMHLTSGTDTGFRHVAQQPGGLQGVNSIQVGAGSRETSVICLPGNPVSVFMTFHMYVAGALAVMSSFAASERGGTVPSGVIARTRVGWDYPSGKTQFVPLRFVDTLGDEAGACWVEPVHPLGSKSYLVASLAGAEVISVVAPDVEVVEPDRGLVVAPLVGWPHLGENLREENHEVYTSE